MIPLEPTPNDVVHSYDWRGDRKHPGNVYFQSLLEKYVPRFVQSKPSADEHKDMVDEILDAVLYQRHGRFLHARVSQKGFCVVLTLDECALKISRALKTKYHEVNPQNRRVRAHDDDDVSFTTGRGPILKRPKGKNLKKRVSSLGTASKMSSQRGIATSTKASLSGVNVSSHGTNNVNTTPYRPKPAVPTPLPSSKRWSYEELYQTNAASSGLYGSREEELYMRRWLNEHKLPQMVGDLLLNHGARNIADAGLLIKFQPHLLESVAALDLWKLEQAISSVAENSFE